MSVSEPINILNLLLDNLRETTDKIDKAITEKIRVELAESIPTEARPLLNSLSGVALEVTEGLVAMVTLLDDKNQKVLGIRGPVSEVDANVGIENALCRYVVGTEEVCEMYGLQESEFAPVNVKGKPGIDAYLGAPWYVDGRVMGSVCVLGQTEKWSHADVKTIKACAKEVTEFFSADR